MNKITKCQMFFIVIGITLFSNPIFAQKRFQPGYIIANNGDTIYGKLKFRTELKNYHSCIFVKNGGNNKIKYFANDIRAYRFIDGNYYVSKELIINNKPQKLFVEFLVDGIVDLFYRKSPYSGEEFYVDNDEKGLVKLTTEEVEITISDEEKKSHGISSNKIYFKKKSYIGIFKVIFKDCPEINNDIEKASLEKSDLIDITKKYHNYVCGDLECITYYKQKKTHNYSFNFNIFTDIQKFVVDDNSYLKDLRPISSYYDSKGIGLNFSFQPQYNIRRYSIELGASLQNSSYYDYYPGRFNNYEFFFNSTILEPSISYVNKDITGICKHFWGIGLSNFIYLKRDNKIISYLNPIYYTRYDSRNFTISTKDILPKNTFAINLFTGLEFKINDNIRPFIQIEMKLLNDFQNRETLFRLNRILRFKTGIAF